ncbi:MAG: TonB-dependent receptor, partial [Chitinophagales bacterium]|nr:TonB-dependent receptor [Chitinophagales bacterium]
FINSFMENIDPKINLVPGIRAYRASHEEPTYAVDARVGYDFSEKTKVSFIAKNITNNQYSVRPAYLEAPRNYTVQLSYEF